MSEEFDGGLTVPEAAELIEATMFEPEAEEIQAEPEDQEPEVQQGPSEHDIAQAKLVSYQQQLTNEAAAIQAAKNACQQLRSSNPAEFSAKMIDLNERTNLLSQAYGQFQQAVTQFDSSITQKAVETRTKEQQKLERSIPGWNEDKAHELTSYLREQGYTDQQIASVGDARTVKLAYQAMQAGKKPLPKVPKRPGPSQEEALEYRMRKNNIRPGTLEYATSKIETLL